MADLFKDILPSIYYTKKDILVDERDYNAFMVNKAVSYTLDGIFYAAEMNRLPDLTNRMQYDFYLHGLKAGRRPFTKWAKPVKLADIEAVQSYYGYSEAKARDSLNILTEDQLVMIRAFVTVGD